MTLRVGGFAPLSTTDWPGMLAAVVFSQGCSWRCRYCHNPGLIPPQGNSDIHWEDVLDFLRRRQGLLDGVVFSGGEPTLQAGLPEAMGDVRSLGYKIGLHTAGMYPKKLEAILPLVDWVGLDVKARFDDYPGITGVAGSGERAYEALQQVLASGVAYEVRTTVHPALLSDADMLALGCELAACGVRHYVVQACRSQGCQDDGLRWSTARDRPLREAVAKLARLFESFSVRE